MVRVEILRRKLAEPPAAKLRNALVHDHADVDDARVHAAIPVVLDGFREYAVRPIWLGRHR